MKVKDTYPNQPVAYFDNKAKKVVKGILIDTETDPTGKTEEPYALISSGGDKFYKKLSSLLGVVNECTSS